MHTERPDIDQAFREILNGADAAIAHKALRDQLVAKTVRESCLEAIELLANVARYPTISQGELNRAQALVGKAIVAAKEAE